MTKKEENEENICHWNECMIQFSTAEELFNHVCSLHIGRKSAGTLSLECRWTGCHAKASKRDHLTSHCRVHIALKPHVCNICTKAFKRPQDLKKHEKIHTEEHHATHKQAKAIIASSAPSTTTIKHSHSPQPPTFGLAQTHLPQQDVKPYSQPQHLHQQQSQQPHPAYPPFSFPALGYPYPFLPQGQTQMGHQQMGQNPGVDQLAQFIAMQQQLNSQAQAAASQGFALPGMTGLLPPGYPLQLGQNSYGLTPQGLPYNPQGVYPLSPHYGFSAPGQPQAHYAQVPLQQHHQQQQQRNSSITSNSSLPPTSLTSTPSHSSLYPTLPNNMYPSPAALPAIKAEDQPSPAQSYKSHYSSISSPSGVPALSPPSLSTPENSYSPTPELESDSSARRSYTGNTVAGKKRGFDEAAGQFLGDLKNKRFHDADSVHNQLDALSSFLLSPEMTGPPALTPGRTADDSSSSNGSDYGRQEGFDREEVDTINQLLLSLGQSLDSDPAAMQSTGLETDPYLFSHHPDHGHQISSLPPIQHNPGASLYPVLPALSGKSATSQYPYNSTPFTYPSLPGQDQSNLRLSKPSAAPTISNDYRQTQYQHVARLQRAAPVEEEQQAMEVDAEMAQAASALLMGKTYSPPLASTSSPSKRPTLPSLATAILGSHEGPRLAPIAGSSSSNAPTTLPHIRDIISLSPRRSSLSDAPDSPTSPTLSSVSNFASPPPPSRPLYPTLSSTPSSASSSTSSRPVSAGGVERLTHRVHKMRLPSTSSDASTSTDHTETGSVLDTEDLSASSDEDDEDQPNARFKKSRMMLTPESMMGNLKEEDEDEDVKPVITEDSESEEDRRVMEEQRKVAQKRKATITYLVGYVNAKYREALAKRGVADLKKAIKPSGLRKVEV